MMAESFNKACDALEGAEDFEKAAIDYIYKTMKENKDTACEPCEQNFERNINRLVKEGKAPTPKARQQKEHEVKSAFAETGKERK